MADITSPLGFGGVNPAQNAPVPSTAFADSNARLGREKASSTGDYIGSIWRQDGLVDGLVADLAGKELTPDPNYNPFVDPQIKELQKGLWPDFQDRIYSAHSAAHAIYLRDRLLQKQEDLVRMGDMGWKGNVGRFALNAIMPDQLAIAMIGGGVTRIAQAAKIARGTSAAIGIGSGAAQNALYEKARQGVNFENDSEKVLEAGLMGGFITAPFALREMRATGRMQAAAALEHDALAAARAHDQGLTLDATQADVVARTEAAHTALRDFENGKIDEVQLEKKMEEAIPSPVEPQREPVFEPLPEAANDAHPVQAEPVVQNETVPAAAAPVTPAAAAAPAPQPHPAEAFVGREVSWQGADGDTIEGTVTHFNAGIGKLIVKTTDGPKAVKLEALDQYAPPEHAPSGFLAQSVGSGQVLPVESVASQRTEQARWRFDIYSSLNGSPVKRVRELAYRLVKDAIGNDPHEAQAMTASEWKKQVQRVHAGEFHRVAGEAYDEAVAAAQVPIWSRAKFKHDFYENVSRVTRGDAQVLADNPAIAGPLNKAAGAQRKFYSSMLEELKAAGVKGAEGIEANELHVSRSWHQGKLREALQTHSPEAVTRLIAGSIQRKAEVIERMRLAPANAALSDAELLMKKAKGFLNAVRDLAYNPALREIQLKGRDMGTLRRELADLGVKDSQIDDLVDLMFEVRPSEGDAGRAAQLKYRFALDENARITTDKGELRLSDLFENDARVLVDQYANTLGGHIGLAKVGIDSEASWQKALREAGEEAKANFTDESRWQKDVKMLELAHRSILGRPINEDSFSGTARAANAFRGYTRGVMLPQLGIAAAFEMNKAVAMFGFRTMLKQMPSLRSLITALRKGYVPDPGLARQIQVMVGFGNEKAASYHRMQEIEHGYFGEALTRAEMGANKVSHAVDVLSGNASFTSLTKQLSAMMATQQAHEYATGLRKLTPKLRERWVHQGLSTDDIDSVLAKLKEHSTAEGGVVKEIRYEDWKADSPKTYEKYQTFISRQVRDAIQDHDLGETMPLMHSTLGKVLAELKTFFLVAHAKNFLKQLHYHDATAMQVWAIGFIGEALAYSTQATINFPGQSDKLTPDKIATAAFMRMSSMGTGSMLVESGYNILTGGESLVQPGMTTNTDNRSLFNTPSLIVAKRLFNAPTTIAGMLNPNAVTTRREVRDLLGALPGTNLYGLKAAGQFFADSFPKVDPNHPGQR